MNLKLIRYLSVTLIVLAFSVMVFAKEGGDKKSANLSKTLGEPVYTKFNINNISTWFKNNGESDINQNGNSGFVFPKGSNRTAVFQSGFLWGGKVDGQIRVGGSVYRQGTVPGYIKADGTRVIDEHPSPGVHTAPDVRIYRVRRDYKDEKADFSSEVADGDGPTADAVRAQYEKDWNEWPAASQGAPYEDVDGDGKYNPAKDIPGVPGADQTIWFVANDFDAAQTDYMYGSQPMGIEEQVTVWGYKATGALGNMLFRKYLIINKSPEKKTFTDMYVSMWSDPDLGDAGDDYVGTDTTLSLGYIYNAKAVDATYNPLPPPAAGFDFFQGPIVAGSAGDKAIFKGKIVPGKKNMKMTAFAFYINSDPVFSDPVQGNYERGTLGFYNLFQGKVSTTGQFFVDPNTGQPTTFAVAGDPVTRKGWIDGQLHPPGDRRLSMASGPFNMAYGDTQEVVVAEIAAGAIPGVDRLGAIGLLKFYDLQAQLAYDNFFNVPTPPPAPVVTATTFDQEIVLYWGVDEAKFQTTENYTKGGYTFQGYNVYQLPTATAQKEEARLIATFDIDDGIGKISDLVFDPTAGVVQSKVVTFGADTKISRYIKINTDAFKGGLPILNGSKYFFAVTSYAYNPSETAVPSVLENPLTVINGASGLVPEKPKPGIRYQAASGDQLKFSRTAGRSDGVLVANVIDPSKVTGQTYKVTFKDDPVIPGSVLWTLAKGTTVLLKDQTNLSGDDTYLITDGLQVKVQGPPPGVKEWDIPKGSRRFTWANGAGLELEGFEGALGWASPRTIFGTVDGLNVVKASETKNVLLKLAKVDFTGDFNPPIDVNDPNVSYGYRYLRGATGAPAKPEFAPFIVNKVGGYAFQAFEKNVPLSAWDVDNPAQPKRLAVGFLENNVAKGLVDGKYWPADYNNVDNVASTGPREWLFIFDLPYSETANPEYQKEILGTVSDAPHRVMYTATWNRRGPAKFSPGNSGDDELAIFTNRVLTKDDVYQLTAPSVINDPNLAKADVEQINVFPNPYYGVNPQELNKYQRFVTFSHLPANATIRIFNLAGQLVRTLQKNSPEQFLRWDLQNENALPAASGLYIVHIDMPDLGKTKILKVAIIQEQQLLDRF